MKSDNFKESNQEKKQRADTKNEAKVRNNFQISSIFLSKYWKN